MSNPVSPCPYCGGEHYQVRWTVIRRDTAKGGFFVYSTRIPRDDAHFAADLAPFTHNTRKLATEAGQRGEFAYKAP